MNGRELITITWKWLSRPSSYSLTQSLFLRLLGLTYLAAFGSLLPQMKGLFGAHGIVPAAQYLVEVRSQLGTRAFTAVPTIFWFGVPDRALVWTCIFGCLGALLLIAGIATRTATLVCWTLYLSIVTVGAPFTNFQWDALLLESGFLALFAGAPWLVWAYRLLLFRLMFESGWVKVTSGDVNWQQFHALRFHFFTQPLPNPIAYYVGHFPAPVLDGFTFATLAIELIAPFLIFGPRRLRQIGTAALMSLQVTILLTGNYGFFNLLALALCLWGLDDQTFAPLARILKARMVPIRVPVMKLLTSEPMHAAGNLAVMAVIILGLAQLAQTTLTSRFRSLRSVQRTLAPFEIVNGYGLFAVMTTTRPEIILQGSDDAEHWVEYEFPYKPGNVHRSLPFVAPHMPRLDWQMWFAALSTFNENRWVGNVMYRILVGDPAVTRLLAGPRWPKPPRYMRAQLFDYTFTTPAERARTGAIWHRELRGVWFGPVSLTGR